MNAEGKSETILDRLRAETRAAHERIEAIVHLQRADYSIQDLKTLLVGFYGFHAGWEPLVALHLPEDWFDPRRKISLLLADLRAVGVSDAEITPLPICSDFPIVRDRIDALASMYVMEGSTLGGQLVSRFMEQQLALHDGRGYSYFQSYGPRVGPMWREFCGRLSGEIVDARSADADRVIQIADQTFLRLGDWLLRSRAASEAAVREAS